jgi:hypothetical protein
MTESMDDKVTPFPNGPSDEEPEKCTCWVLMRGDHAHPEGWESDEYELIVDPACPEHGPKSHDIMDDIYLGGVG